MENPEEMGERRRKFEKKEIWLIPYQNSDKLLQEEKLSLQVNLQRFKNCYDHIKKITLNLLNLLSINITNTKTTSNDIISMSCG